MHVVHTKRPRERAWVFPRGLLALLVAGAAVDILILVVRELHEQPRLGIAFLLVIPVALVSGLGGPRTGGAFAIGTFAAMVLHGELTGMEIPPGGYLTRAAVLLSIPALLW